MGRTLGILGVVASLFAGCAPLERSDSMQPGRARVAPVDDEAEPDHPDESAEFRYAQRLSDDGAMPHNGLMRAKAQRDAMLAARRAAAGGDQPEGGGLSPMSWTWLGPGNIGGRIRSILTHPSDPNLLYIGGVSGGIWKTTNGGAAWQPLNDFIAALTVSCMAMDPSDASTLYAGTGESFRGSLDGGSNTASMHGAGIFKSTDAGATWVQLASTTGSAWYYVNRLAIHPTNSNVMLAATNSGIYRSTDAGATWSQRTTNRAPDIRFHPTDGAKAVAGRDNGSALYSLDGGITWLTAVGASSGGRVEVRYARSNPTTVYTSINRNGGEIWRSTDGGQTYALRSTGVNYVGGSGYYYDALWVDPTNPNTVIVGGQDLWRSTNAGTTLARISQWQSAPNSAHADHHAIVEATGFDGTTNRRVYFGNDGGIYRTDNVYTVSLTSGWQELNNQLGITQFYGGAVNATSGTIVGGTQDNGTLRYIGGTETWDTMFGGDGGFCAADPTDPDYFYGEYVYCQLHRSTDAGATSDWIDTGISDAGSSATANFICPVVLDSNNANRLLAGASRLWRSNDAKADTPAWASIKADVGSRISTIAVAQGNADVIWVGHNNGDVYRTANGTAAAPAWTRVDANGVGLPNRWCSKIVIDRTDHTRVYVTFMGYTADNVWRTTDDGAAWTQNTGSGIGTLPSIPVAAIAEHATQPGWLYVGTDIGVFSSTDDGATWQVADAPGPYGDGPANVEIDELFWQDDDTLIAATFGRGMYAADIMTPVCPTITTPPAGQTVCAGAAATFSVIADGSAPLNYQWRKDMQDIVGANAVAFAIAAAQPGDAGGYDVIVSNACGSITSAAAPLLVNTPMPGDFDCDGDIDLLDYAAFAACLTGPAAGPLPPACAPADVNPDSTADLLDFAVLQSAFTG